MVAASLPFAASDFPPQRRRSSAAPRHPDAEANKFSKRVPGLSIGASIDYLFGMTPQGSPDTGVPDHPAGRQGSDLFDFVEDAGASPADVDVREGSQQAAVCQGPADQAELAALMERVAEQDEAAFAIFYDRTAGRVMGLAIRITRNRPVAEEVTEDCFWQVWRDAPRYSAERGQVLTWLLSIARSRAIDALRRLVRQHSHEQPVDVDFLQTLAVTSEVAGDEVDADQRRERLQQALGELDPTARQLLTLAFFHGLSHAEVAEHAGMPLGTVKSNIRRALISMKRRLQTGASDQPENES